MRAPLQVAKDRSDEMYHGRYSGGAPGAGRDRGVEWGPGFAEVARRLLAGQGRPGAWTPAARFGSSLAEACGGEYLIE